ncbi:MAG: type I methionyl aminopeptidase [Clostridia bacterium]|nr:type I methionyl aminopeptidase [Clostridia bacterium]
MIHLKNEKQLEIMRIAGRITGEAIQAGREAIKPGVTTAEVDHVIHAYIVKCGAKPTFLGYGGFPASACISVNDEVIHGIPSHNRVLKEGDIVSIDVGAFYRGYTGDSAATFPVGKISPEAERIIRVTEESFYRALEVLEKGGARVGDIGHAVESYCVENGCSVVRRYVGHGVGAELHEDPEIPNFGTPGHGIRIIPGMTICVEPMVALGTGDVYEMPNGWTVRTKDGKLSSHYEHSIAITSNGPELLTKV